MSWGRHQHQENSLKRGPQGLLTGKERTVSNSLLTLCTGSYHNYGQSSPCTNSSTIVNQQLRYVLQGICSSSPTESPFNPPYSQGDQGPKSPLGITQMGKRGQVPRVSSKPPSWARGGQAHPTAVFQCRRVSLTPWLSAKIRHSALERMLASSWPLSGSTVCV